MPLNCKLKCKECGATCWEVGREDAGNSISFEFNELPSWSGGNGDDGCSHENFEIVVAETIEPEPNYGDFA